MKSEFIDTPAELECFLYKLDKPTAEPRILYIDLEGHDLGRDGTLSLMTILDPIQNRVVVIDVTTLKHSAFNTPQWNWDRSLKLVLESDKITKVFFDVRNDSDALFSHYGIRLEGVEDLQLWELARRSSGRRDFVSGLAKCIERDADMMSGEEKAAWKAGKDRGRQLFDPARGGSYAVFDQRPLGKEILEYCVQDVVVMPNLRDIYRRATDPEWHSKIAEETRSRIEESQSKDYNGKGRHKALGPAGWSDPISDDDWYYD